jgi:DNA processing protein
MGNGNLPSSTSDFEIAPWLALSRVKGLGCVSFKKLINHFVDATKALSASAAELADVDGLDKTLIDALTSFCEWQEVEQEICRARDAGVRLVSFASSDYPPRLRTIADPPPFLYSSGEICAVDDNAVAVVGTRSASDYGRKVAREIAAGLASLGFTVISGMARGIDAMAHDAALTSGGRTIAVLGSGVDIAYPPEHDKLYQRIRAQGAVISELPMGTRPLAFNFPARNRLISGLSMGVVVVEATEKSGSLITAASALDQGREIFAVPGQAGASRSRGPHQLIRQGAKLVERVDDIIEEIAPQLSRRGQSQSQAPRRLPPDAGVEVRAIFDLLQDRPLHIDDLVQNSGMAAARVSQILLELELQGFLRQLPGSRYSAER